VGDPPRRDADRYLFLQLFASASAAFHVSWQGFDPRDGGVREPASVVAELLDVAAHYHADPGDARKHLVVHHALQPFSPAAFGAAHVDEAAADTRRFSYDERWQAAAGSVPDAQPLPPFSMHPLSRADDVAATLSLDGLRSALNKPQAYWLRQGLQLRLPGDDIAPDDHEPLGPPDALLRHALRERVFAAWLHAGGRPVPDALQAQLLARALLPAGADGRSVLADVLEQVAPFAGLALREGLQQATGTLPYALRIDGAALDGTLDGVHPRGLLRAALRPQGLHGGHVLRHRLDALVAATQGLPLLELHADGGDVTLVEHPPAPADQARAALRALFALQRRMAADALPFLPKSGHVFAIAKDEASGLKAAASEWRGGYNTAGERSAATALALRGREPFVDGGRDAEARFAALSRAVFDALLHADATALEALP
jgi:exodeoxyribonuclease V gamma subunit